MQCEKSTLIYPSLTLVYIYNIYIYTHQTIINLSNSISRVMSHLLVNMVNMIVVSCYAATDGVCLPSGND